MQTLTIPKKESNLKRVSSYNPFRSLISQAFNDELFDFPLFNNSSPAVNVRETDQQFTIEVAAPGYKKDSFDIQLSDNYLTISSKAESVKEENKEGYSRKEFSSSSFKRSFTLPQNVDTEMIKATYNDGILNVEIPKSESSPNQSRSITIE